MSLPGHAAPQIEDFESKLKAAYLVNIADFVTWPKSGDDIALCANRNARVAQYLSPLTEKRLGTGKKLKIVIDPRSLSECDMLYWDDASEKALGSGGLSNRHKGLLIVSDIAGADSREFAIVFYVRNLKLRFYVNKDAMQGADYRISSKLLRLSRETE